MLVFILGLPVGLPVGSPPVDALLIVLAVVVASATMQVAGGIDWMVSIAAKLIEADPTRITFIAPLVSFLFAAGAGTSNILYPLLPVISDLSYRNGIRPSRPLPLSVVATGIALACSPVSAAMAEMVTLTAVSPYDFELIDIIKVTFPAALFGIVGAAFVVNRLGKDIANDPEIQAKIAAGTIPSPDMHSGAIKVEVTVTKEGRNAALIFFAGVAAIVIYGLFKDLRPQDAAGNPIAMTPMIQVIMLLVGTLTVLVCRPKLTEVSATSVFKAGMVSAIALFGLAWLTDTFLGAHTEMSANGVGALVTKAPWIFALGMFLVCVLTTSQSTATRTVVPIGLAAGMAPALLSGMWVGAFAGIYLLPTNGSQIAAANFDASGSTKLGTKLYDHSFFIPTLILAVTTIIPGVVLGAILSWPVPRRDPNQESCPAW
ncbi:anaerobic C4-dicarboxylate transporter [Paeniglutamicibacter cryotolerans]|uniref:Anaerobic C4-dicarboxylate transporter DcuA/anaerobic C4-dicarboxylate transporter DcuB n=1 Tax=Paeniglutamicibacter cryotolerans TaxID=670079 RepID=A0A839QJU4_9MICC|nr:anaerobic C4-dicarboxylate transporter DcuA/anaerobic C4-dicarboxylate transporter DcuB [Paeniglutamicibacter cryotolerans]